jgi:ubiquinone/menaquinone biosynthesis C-methylase UbiE
MDTVTVHSYFNSDGVVEHYAEAAQRVGLWRSEKLIFQRLFKTEDTLLELGCGCGRIALELSALGYRNIMAIDYARNMIKQARLLARRLDRAVHFRVGDATRLEFEDELFDGAIFGFNGLMQIPGAARREKAMREVFRVLRPGAWFVFTAHDQENPRHRAFWNKERQRWRSGKQLADLDDFGDRFEPTPLGDLYIHVPTNDAIRQTLKAVGFRIEADVLRSTLANESPEVREFSDDTRFWVVQKPASGPQS